MHSIDESVSGKGSKLGSDEYNIGELNKCTPLDLVYNEEVKNSISLFLGNRRGDIERAINRSGYYFPIIEEALDRHNLPLELKYIAVIESGLNPFARSSSGAVGLWQFLYSTCSLFDLTVDSYIDERQDPYISTESACKYLRYLYDTYHDWNLVMASYVGGPGEVRKAIARSGGSVDYWKLRPYLSEQTKKYIPSIIAIAYLMEYADAFELVTKTEKLSNLKTDSIHIQYGVSFQQISSLIDISQEELKQLNPIYRQMYIPDREKACVLILPDYLIEEYLKNEKRIISYVPVRTDYHYLIASAGNTENKTRLIHTVSRGEYFHKIALHYNCTLENLLAWNHLNDLNLHPGQQLEIWVDE